MMRSMILPLKILHDIDSIRGPIRFPHRGFQRFGLGWFTVFEPNLNIWSEAQAPLPV